MKCPECGSRRIYFMSGEYVCKSCGLVLEDNAIEPDQRIASNSSHPSLSVAGSYEAGGRIVKRSWLLSTKEKNQEHMDRTLKQLANRLMLPNYVVNEAKIIFRNCTNRRLTVGRSNLSFLLAGVYIACLIHGIPKIPIELTLSTEIHPKTMMQAYRVIRKKFTCKVPTLSPLDLTQRFGSELGLKQSTITMANEIIIKANGDLRYMNPQSLMAAALYVATKKNNDYRTQREIANVTGVIEPTIRKRSKEIFIKLKMQTL